MDMGINSSNAAGAGSSAGRPRFPQTEPNAMYGYIPDNLPRATQNAGQMPAAHMPSAVQNAAMTRPAPTPVTMPAKEPILIPTPVAMPRPVTPPMMQPAMMPQMSPTFNQMMPQPVAPPMNQTFTPSVSPAVNPTFSPSFNPSFNQPYNPSINLTLEMDNCMEHAPQPTPYAQPAAVQGASMQMPAMTAPAAMQMPTAVKAAQATMPCYGPDAMRYADTLKDFINDEYHDCMYYSALARRAPTACAQRVFRMIANDEKCHARKLAAAYFLITGKQYMPTRCTVDPVNIPCSYAQALRDRYIAEMQGAAEYRQFAAQVTDPCLKQLALDLAQDESQHAQLILEQIQCL